MNDCCTNCDRELTIYYSLSHEEILCEGCYDYKYKQGFNESEDE